MQWILQNIPIGKNIQRLRLREGLTQAQLAARLQLMGSSMSRSTLANIESGRRNIKAEDLKALKIALNADYEEIFGDSDA